jgi:hypothetical protein
MSSTNEKLDIIHEIVKDMKEKIEKVDDKVTNLQVDSGISQENRKACTKRHTILHTIIILCISGAVGFAWIMTQKWADVSTKVASISKDIEIIKDEAQDKGARFGHQKGSVGLAPAPAPDLPDLIDIE